MILLKLQLKIQKKFLEFKFTYYKTPIGFLKITGNSHGISSIIFIEDINKLEQFKNIKSPFDVPVCLKECIDQLIGFVGIIIIYITCIRIYFPIHI